MGLFDVFVAFIWGVVEGITEWLPISSTGHMILVKQFLNFKDQNFSDMFLVVVQLGAILAVVILFWKKIFPFDFKALSGNADGEKRHFVKMDIMTMWFKIVVACLPVIVIGVLKLDEKAEELFYNAPVVAAALIFYGILFIIVEIFNKGRKPRVTSLKDITYSTALLIGVFQMLAAIVPGTSRSGATIIGALLIGLSRGVAAEFTFFLAIPAMFGASLLKLVKLGMSGGAMGVFVLLFGMLIAFIVSIFVIKFFMGYIRKHDFKLFGYYRIILGILVLILWGLGVVVA